MDSIQYNKVLHIHKPLVNRWYIHVHQQDNINYNNNNNNSCDRNNDSYTIAQMVTCTVPIPVYKHACSVLVFRVPTCIYVHMLYMYNIVSAINGYKSRQTLILQYIQVFKVHSTIDTYTCYNYQFNIKYERYFNYTCTVIIIIIIITVSNSY